MKRFFAVLLAIAVLLPVVPLTGLNTLISVPVAQAKTYAEGDIITFGGYPQSEVTDPDLIAVLDDLPKSWESYQYYSGTGHMDLKMHPGNFMRFADIVFNGTKYRAVTFDSYRPSYSYSTLPVVTDEDENEDEVDESMPGDFPQYDNGYRCKEVYYFQFEPLTWRVLDPDEGFVLCENIIDAQPYQNMIYSVNHYYYWTDYWLDYDNEIPANNFERSSIRQWLTDTFYQTAFSDEEQKLIRETELDENPATTDKIFMLSGNEATDSRYGFANDIERHDPARMAQGTAYAKCQGLWVSDDEDYAGNSFWMLRTDCGSYHGDTQRVYKVSYNGYVDDYYSYNHRNVDYTEDGIRPAFRFKAGIVETENPDGAASYTVSYDANGGTGGPTAQVKRGSAPLQLSETVPLREYSVLYIANGGSLSETGKTISAEFTEWNTEPDGSGIAYAPGSLFADVQSVTLYAQWENAALGELPVPTRKNYDFDGWYTAASGGTKVTEETVISQDRTLYAHWGQLASYPVTYDANGGTGAPAAQKKTHGTSLTLSKTQPDLQYTVTFQLNGGTLAEDKKTYHAAFAEWNTAKDGSGTAYAPGAAYNENRAATLYAQWKQPTAGELPTPTRSGYSFAGWFTAASGGAQMTEDAVIFENQTIYARWSQLASYNVSYNANGGKNAPAAQTKLDGVNLTLSTKIPTKEYQLTFKANGGTLSSDTATVAATFKNWNTKADGSGSGYPAGGTYSINESAVFYARWAEPTAGELPIPTRSGYNFDGWYTAASGGEKVVSSTTVSRSQTLYAHWTTAPKSYRYLESSDIFTFNNGGTYFGTTYYVSDADFLKLVGYVREFYQNDPSMANTTINNLQALRATSWGGSCYGMAVVTMLDKSNALQFNETFDPQAKTMSEVSSPAKNLRVKSAINYYFLSQVIPYVSTYKCKTYTNSASDWKIGLKQLVTMSQEGQPLLFGYYFRNATGSHGHAIVIKGYEKAADGSHHIIAYDNRYPEKDTIIAVDDGFRTCVVNGTENAYTIEYTQDMSAFDLIDINGTIRNTDNKLLQEKTGELLLSAQETLSAGASTAEVCVSITGTYTIENSENETLIVENGQISAQSTMDIANERMMVASTESGEDCSTLTFTVADSDFFSFETESGEMNVSVRNASIFASAETKGAKYVTISKNDGVFVTGDAFTYVLSLSVNTELCDMVSISGTADNDVKLTFKGKKINASGVDAKNGTVTVHSNIVDTDNYTYMAGYDSFVISAAESGAAGDVEILGSAGNNGLYNVNIGSLIPDAGKEEYALGDVDGNGKVEAADARLALRAAVQLSNEPADVKEGSAGYKAADYDKNGKVEAADARCILRVSVQLDPFG